MSYCRFSSDDFKSDVYVWRGIKYMISVAEKRHQFDRSSLPPKPDRGDEKFAAKQAERHSKLIRKVDQADTKRIGGPYDGDTFTASTPGETADKLEKIDEAGYHVPDHVINTLREEEQNRN